MLSYILPALLIISSVSHNKTPETTAIGKNDSIVYHSSRLMIKKIAPHTFQHISYLQTESFGNVECNGMIATDKKEAIILIHLRTTALPRN